MKKISTELEDCYIIEPDKFGDERGYFSPYFIQKNFDELGFINVVQGSKSKSAKGVLRGLHFQLEPKNQAKIVEVINGKAIDVVVDLRYDSPTYCDWTKVLLTPEDNNQLFKLELNPDKNMDINILYSSYSYHIIECKDDENLDIIFLKNSLSVPYSDLLGIIEFQIATSF